MGGAPRAAGSCTTARTFSSECSENADCAATEFCAGGLCEGGVGICSEKPTTCSDVTDEACGCDGITYRNLCEVRSLGLRAALLAGCPCEADNECAGDQYCESDNTCELPGNCKFVPDDCEGEGISAVCGCDEVTYRNECEVRLLRLSLADLRAGCACANDGECGDDQYCSLGNDCVAPGNCDFPPESCDDEIDPVCGCDDVTYVNECQAQLAEVSIADTSDGCPCDDDGACGTGQYCDLGSTCTAPGNCNIPPSSCEGESINAVCGCDDVTYANRCEAELAQVSIEDLSDGCPCEDNDACGAGQYCALGDQCGVVDGGAPMGTCDFRPTDCDGEPDEPVCGCDGVTYDNECEANLAGVTVATEGACP